MTSMYKKNILQSMQIILIAVNTELISWKDKKQTKKKKGTIMTTRIASPSRMKEIAMEENRRKIEKEVEDILQLQIVSIKEAMIRGKNFCYWIPLTEYLIDGDEIPLYRDESVSKVISILRESGYDVSKTTINW